MSTKKSNYDIALNFIEILKENNCTVAEAERILHAVKQRIEGKTENLRRNLSISEVDRAIDFSDKEGKFFHTLLEGTTSA